MRTLPTLALSVPLLAATSQTAGAGEPSPRVVADAAVAVSDEGGRVRAAGRGWSARFEGGSFRFLPALDASAGRSGSARFTLESVRRGDAVLWTADGVAAPRLEGTTVRYDRAPWLTERYDLLPEGVEQSFVFAEELGGAGELVVRGRLETRLEPRATGEIAGALDLALDGVDAVRWGAVTGVAADGATAPGRMRLDGAALELALPADFVDRAAYPLVLDPLVGPTFPVATSAVGGRCDVAYDVSTDTYVVVWAQVGVFESDVLAQRVSPSGQLVGPAAFVNATAGYHTDPTVASVNAGNRVIVAWEGGTSVFGPFDVLARALSVSSGLPVGNQSPVAATAASETDPDAGGEVSTVHDGALVVWRGASTVHLAAVRFDGVGIAVSTSFALGSGPASQPAISKSGGAGGAYLAVWSSTAVPNEPSIRGIVVDRDGSVLSPELDIAAEPGFQHTVPDVDGDGERFLVAFSRTQPSTSKADVRGRLASFHGPFDFAFDGPTFTITADDGADVAVGKVGGRFLVSYSTPTGPDLMAQRYLAIGAQSGEICEGPLTIEGGSFSYSRAAMATQRSGGGGPSHNGALLSFFEFDFPGPTILHGQSLDAFGAGGGVVDLGGGCGTGGQCSLSGPAAIGFSEMEVWLTGADPGASVALLNLSTPQPGLACGPCVTAPFGTVLVRPVIGGDAVVALPIPCDPTLVDASLDLQWAAVLPTAESPCVPVPDVSASNRLRVTIQ